MLITLFTWVAILGASTAISEEAIIHLFHAACETQGGTKSKYQSNLSIVDGKPTPTLSFICYAERT